MFILGMVILVKGNLGNMPILGKVILCMLDWGQGNIWQGYIWQDQASPDWARSDRATIGQGHIE